MQNTEAIIGYLNETRQRIGLCPVRLDDGGQVVITSTEETPIGIGQFCKQNPDRFKSISAARWHLSQRKTNGMLGMDACVELPSKVNAEKARLAVFPSTLIRWCQGERPWKK